MGFGAGARRAEERRPTNRGSSLLRPLFSQLLYQQRSRTFVLQRPHRLVVTPDQVPRQLLVQILNTPEGLPVVKIFLVGPVASLHLAVVPRRPGRDQLVHDAEPGLAVYKILAILPGNWYNILNYHGEVSVERRTDSWNGKHR